MRRSVNLSIGLAVVGWLVLGGASAPSGNPSNHAEAGSIAMDDREAVRAVDFESRKVYQSDQRPSYTSWVSFFPGEEGQWYISCEEVTRPEVPLPQCSPEEWFGMGLPNGYDKSQYLMEAVILESRDDMQTWRVISREPYRQHHTVGQFGTARTPDGRFLRFIWACYSLDPGVAPNETLYSSEDDGKTWRKMPAFHHDRFSSWPHRLRTLRDGTMVLCVPMREGWGTPERPTRTARNLNAIGERQMTIFCSFDQGRTWEGPLPILSGQSVSETDFVELPSGDLLFVNNSIFAQPGRQIVYRDGKRFTPGPLEKSLGKTGLRDANTVPETVCITPDGILVGCMRAGSYHWSDDLGLTWQRLQGIPRTGPEVYQPWIHSLPDGRIACAGHFGRDAPISGDNRDDQYISLHIFKLEVLRKTQSTRLVLEREFDAPARRWKNSYVLTLQVAEEPLPDQELEFWYVGRGEPGYDSFGKSPLEDRIKAGGKLVRVRTDAAGEARVDLSHLDGITDEHNSIQVIGRFNSDYSDPSFKPCQTPQFEFYSIAVQDSAL